MTLIGSILVEVLNAKIYSYGRGVHYMFHTFDNDNSTLGIIYSPLGTSIDFAGIQSLISSY